MTNETLAHQAALKRWMCQIYWTRGNMTDEVWAKFKVFCEANGYMLEPTPGVRVDGINVWDALEQTILEDFYKGEAK